MPNQLLAALSLAAVHSSKCTGNSSSLPPSDCAFWHDFYNALGGGSWVYCNTRTDPCGPACVWHDGDGGLGGGVHCFNTSGTLRLSQISLTKNNMRGSLPNTIGLASALTFLGLANNQLEGSVPDALAELSELAFLGLGGGPQTGAFGLTGSLPAWIANLTKLKIFDVHTNRFSGLVPALDFTQYDGYCDIGGITNKYTCPLPLGAAGCDQNSNGVVCTEPPTPIQTRVAFLVVGLAIILLAGVVSLQLFSRAQRRVLAAAGTQTSGYTNKLLAQCPDCQEPLPGGGELAEPCPACGLPGHEQIPRNWVSVVQAFVVLVDMAADLTWVYALSLDHGSTRLFALAAVFLVLPVVVNAITLYRFFIKELRANAAFSAWALEHTSVIASIFALSLFKFELVQLMWCRVRAGTALHAPLGTTTRAKVVMLGGLGNMLGDVPQLALLVMIHKQYPEHFSFAAFVSLVCSTLFLLQALIRRIVACVVVSDQQRRLDSRLEIQQAGEIAGRDVGSKLVTNERGVRLAFSSHAKA